MGTPQVRISKENNRIYTFTPYDRGFIAKARKLGGIWDIDKKAWCFAAVDEERVRKLLIDIFKTDGSPQETATVRFPAQSFCDEQEINLCGRVVARRWGRDSKVRLGENVIIVCGSFAGRAGSVRYPIIGDNDVILEVRDLNVEVAKTIKGAEIISEETLRREELEAEKARLLTRIADIDELLSDL